MDMDKNRDLLILGNFLGRLLELYPSEVRFEALKDIEELELNYCTYLREFSGLRPMLAPSLRKIELCRRVPNLNRDPRLKNRELFKNYADAIEAYLVTIPQDLRVGILKDMCNIISNHGANIEGDDNSNSLKYFLNIIEIFESLI